MLEFLKTYWKLIALGLLFVLDLVLLILNRRKPVKVFDSVHQSILSILPDLVNSAEAAFVSGHGPEKLEMVKQLVHNFLMSVYGLQGKDVLSYDSFIKINVEKLLSTPQKKEEKL